MGGMVSGVVGGVQAVGSILGGGSGGKGGQQGQQAQQPQMCMQASVATDNHNSGSGSSNNDGLEPVVQGGLGTSFGSPATVGNGGQLPTTYADGGNASNASGSSINDGGNHTLMDSIAGYKKLFCVQPEAPKWACDKAEVAHYTHPAGIAPQGGLATIHQGSFGGGFDDGGKVSAKPAQNPPSQSVLETIGRAILPGLYSAGDKMKCSPKTACTQAQQQVQSTQPPPPPKEFHFADGGDAERYHNAAPEGHNPEFITGVTGHYADGKGTGQSDDIPAMLNNGDYVFDSDAVSALGDGSSKAGRTVLESFLSKLPHHAASGGDLKPVPAKIADGEFVLPASFVTALGNGDNKRGSEILDGLRKRLREHKRSASDSKIPPKAKDPIDYIKEGE